MQPMYPGIANSPSTTLTQAIDATQTTLEVADGTKLPDAPNLATINPTQENAETILYTGKIGNTLTGVTRGFQGTAQTWPAGTKVARRFTEYDYEALRQNVEEVNTAQVTHESDTIRHTTQAEKDAWNAKETPEGAQAKADTAEASAKAYADATFETKADAASHKAEIATSTQLGHIKVGQNLAIDSDGTLHAQASGGKKVARFVIGTSTAGWTENDVDYLCDGVDDQEEINQAIQDLPADGGEIIILDGTYNIGARIDVNKNNVTIRGNGDATILKRMWNSSFAEGVITLNIASNCKIENLQIDGNKSVYTSLSNYGIFLYFSNHNTVTDNVCNNNRRGISLISSGDNIITGNTCDNNGFGIYLDISSNNTITGNTCNNNDSTSGIYLIDSNDNTITGNTCNNNDTGITLASSNNNTVTGNTFNSNYNGIYLYSSNNSIITGNTCNNNSDGIFLTESCDNNTITGNTCNNNNYGIALYASNNNTITGNTCNNNSEGITLFSSNNNTIAGNTCIRGTGQSSDYTSSQYTIHLSGSGNSYNLISSNNCMGKNVTIGGGTSNTSVNNKYN